MTFDELTKFQFHKGTIETLSPAPTTSAAEGFQFHKGTIETAHVPAQAAHQFQFQFHKGTIETPITGHPDAKEKFNFNSIKVRLKRWTTDSMSYQYAIFQFHKGTIETSTRKLHFRKTDISIP